MAANLQLRAEENRCSEHYEPIFKLRSIRLDPIDTFLLVLMTLIAMGSVLLMFGAYDYVTQSSVLKQKLDTEVRLAQERMSRIDLRQFNFQEQQAKKFIEAEASLKTLPKLW